MEIEYINNGYYTKGVDPEVTCWHCKKTFLCDCMDATCRLCGAPFDKNRCSEFKFTPMTKNNFEDYLREQHAKQYTGTDDEMPGDSLDWLQDLLVEDWLSFADKYHTQQKKKWREGLSENEIGFLLFYTWNKFTYKVVKEYWTGRHIKMTTKTVCARLATALSKRLDEVKE